MRSRALLRTWHLVALLRHCGGLSLADLACRTGATTRTVRRDLAVLEECHIPIVKTEDGRWRIVKGAPCPVCALRHRDGAAGSLTTSRR